MKRNAHTQSSVAPAGSLAKVLACGVVVCGIIGGVLFAEFAHNDPICNGEKLVRAGKVQEAVVLYTDALTGGSYVNDPSVLMARAYAYRNLKKNDLSLADLNKAEKICIPNPSYCSICKGHSKLNDVYVGRARTYYNLGKYNEAIADANKVFTTAQDPDAYFERAIANKALRKYQEAEQDLDTGLTLAGANREERFYHERANIKLLRENKVAALADLNQALAMKDCADAFFDRAMIYKDNGDLLRCKDDLTKAINADQTMERAFHERARLLMREGKNKEALADLNSAKKIDATCELLKDDFAAVQFALKK